MQLWQDGLMAMLAAIGLASLMWMVVRLVLFSRPDRYPGAAAVIPAQGDGDYLEQQVRTLQRLGQEQGLIGMILLVDCGLSEEGRRLARILAREDRRVTLCRTEDLGRYLTF